MGAIATFNYAIWSEVYPEFSTTVTEMQAQMLWYQAEIFHRNDGSGPVKKEQVQAVLLGMITAHLAQLLYGSSIQTVSGLVGRINSASEGSVSVGTEFQVPPGGNAAWYAQTKYGANYWAASAAYRTMKYFPARGNRNFNPFPFG